MKPIRWILTALSIKGCLFAFLAYHFYVYWPQDLNLNVFFNASGDTSGYYEPCENFVKGIGYDSYCRMPGLLPIYALLRVFCSITLTKTLIIFLQFICSSVAVYVLAQTSVFIFNNQKLFVPVFFIFSISSFVSVWDHVGYSDSFATSFFIYSAYFLFKYKYSKQSKHLLLSSLFLVWSLFFRPTHGVFFPVYFLVLLQIDGLTKNFFYKGILFAAPLILFLSLWTTKNYKQTGKIIVLQGKLNECFSAVNEQVLAIRKLITSWGDDIQPWAKGTAGEWFFGKKYLALPDLKNYGKGFTPEYNVDSLKVLRKAYYLSINDSLPLASQSYYKNYVLIKSKIYDDSYKNNYPFNGYVLSKLVLLKRLMLPNRLDDLPFPKMSEMNMVQKLLKLFWYLLLLTINVFGFAGIIYALWKKDWFAFLPLSVLFVLIYGFGIVEQRYLVPLYPVFLMYAINLLYSGYDIYKGKKTVSTL